MAEIGDRVFLGIDQHGFRYYRDDTDRKVYQMYPTDRDYWSNGENKRNKGWNGYMCGIVAWENAFHKLIVNAAACEMAEGRGK